MKRYKNMPVTAADAGVDPIEELSDIMDDDFSYFMAGLAKLQRDGGEDARAAYNIAIQLNDAIQSAIANISEYMQGE